MLSNELTQMLLGALELHARSAKLLSALHDAARLHPKLRLEPLQRK
jgi:hypothetical protein